MGQKVNPIGFRVTVSKDWRSRWFAVRGEYCAFLHEDIRIRDYIRTREDLKQASIAKVTIERHGNRVRVVLFSARRAAVVGRRGQVLEQIRDDLSELTGKEVFVDVLDVERPEAEAQLVAENVALNLEHRLPFRRVMKRAVSGAMDCRVKGVPAIQGIKIVVSGRLGGHEMSRTESYKDGKIPLHTLRADIDYGFTEAHTAYGSIGVKVWVYKGEQSNAIDAQARKAP